MTIEIIFEGYLIKDLKTGSLNLSDFKGAGSI
jgi:hypothetical protein